MTGERLVCANCTWPVSEGRCSVCRAYRDQHRMPTQLVALLAVLAALVMLVGHQLLTA